MVKCSKKLTPRFAALSRCLSLFFFFNFFNVYLFFWDRERQSMSGGGSERGRHRIWNRLQALSCQHRARLGAWTHGPRDRDLSRSRPLNRLSHPGAPISMSLNSAGLFLLTILLFLRFTLRPKLLVSQVDAGLCVLNRVIIVGNGGGWSGLGEAWCRAVVFPLSMSITLYCTSVYWLFIAFWYFLVIIYFFLLS